MNFMRNTDVMLTGLYFSMLITVIVYPVAKIILEIIKNNWPP